jgi:hypothetical protein
LNELFLAKNFELLKESPFFLQFILPKICLNRYVPVEGVKSSSLTLWKIIVKDNGIHIIKSNLLFFLETYLHEMASLSPTTKEASCRCIQELIMRVSDESHFVYFEKKVYLIYSLLVKCIKDPVFNVRESALNATGYIFNVSILVNLVCLFLLGSRRKRCLD